MIAPSSVNSKLTDEGGPNVFRVCGRDDRQGTKVAGYLAEHWAGRRLQFWMTVRSGEQASPTQSGAGCMSAA
jgi:ABC-type branched-subunit amino acid transport system substrate-binding protein